MPAASRSMTFADLEQIPESRGRYELRHGEPIEAPPAKHRHFRIQQNLRRAIEAAAGDAGEAVTEIGFRPEAEHEYWIADVAFVSREKWLGIPDDGNLQGVPEIVAEVLSPSNSASEMLDRELICLEHGGQEFWVVDPVRRQVKVSGCDGRSAVYRSGREIPLYFGGSLSVDSIFA